MSPTKVLLVFTICLVLLVYIQHYRKHNTAYKIIQSSLDKIDINTLYERYPIIISDKIVDPTKLIDTLFKYSYAFKAIRTQNGSPIPYRTLNKYLIIYNIKNDIDINIISPFYQKDFHNNTTALANSNVEYVTIKLKKQQVLILPSYWLYQTMQPHHTIAFNDPFSLLLQLWARLIHPSYQPPPHTSSPK
jgi:hypothetical protein